MAHITRTGWIVLVVVGFVLAVLMALVIAAYAGLSEPGYESLDEAQMGVHVTVTTVDRALGATHATADFGIEDGVRSVVVRILDSIHLEVGLTTDRTLALAAPPRVCLVGPYSAPDDAGLTDRCWGTPDLTGLFASALPVDDAGRPVLGGSTPIVASFDIARGTERCDYPPGEWQLEMTLEPWLDGAAAGSIDLEPVTFTVPVESGDADPLPLLRPTRYCGLATKVFLDQGEPTVIELQ